MAAFVRLMSSTDAEEAEFTKIVSDGLKGSISSLVRLGSKEPGLCSSRLSEVRVISFLFCWL